MPASIGEHENQPVAADDDSMPVMRGLVLRRASTSPSRCNFQPVTAVRILYTLSPTTATVAYQVYAAQANGRFPKPYPRRVSETTFRSFEFFGEESMMPMRWLVSLGS